MNNNIVSAKEAFTTKHELLNTTRLPFDWFTNDIETQIRRVRMSRDDLANAMLLSTNKPTQPASFAEEFAILNPPNNTDENQRNDSHMGSNYATDATFHSLVTTVLAEEEIETNIASMTKDQRTVFSLIRNHYCNKNQPPPEPLKETSVQISGGTYFGH